MGLADVAAGHPFDVEAFFAEARAFLADHLALARGKAGEKIVERAIAAVEPVELGVVAGKPLRRLE